MQRTIRPAAAWLLVIGLVLGACSAGAAGGVAGTGGMVGPGGTDGADSPQPDVPVDKAGGRAATVLTLGTNDTPGDASADYLERLAADLKRISAGRVTIDIKYRAAGENILRYDQRIAELVRSGDVDMGLVPTRAFDELGVTSLRALQALFLLTDDEAIDSVVSSAIGDDLMSGLPSAGFEGLALWPEALRHPYGFDAPIVTLSDFDDLSIRTPVSSVSFDLMKALGAVPRDLAEARQDDDAAESGVRTIVNLNRPGVLTGNITFFPKIQMLVAGRVGFARLTDEERRLVRDAAAVTSVWVREHREHEETAVATHCRNGGILVLAKPRDVARIVAAAAPVYANSRKIPSTKRLIGEIRDTVEGAAREAGIHAQAVRLARSLKRDRGADRVTRARRRLVRAERNLSRRHQRGLPRLEGHQPDRGVLQRRHLHLDVQGRRVPPSPRSG